LNELFFTRRIALVEGLEDIAYINSWLYIKNLWDKFRSSGYHIVATNNKSNMIVPSIIAIGLNIPTIAIFDADNDCKAVRRSQHENNNRELLAIFSREQIIIISGT
jgi:putative ATP-dependent endonuclease of the OLD family